MGYPTSDIVPDKIRRLTRAGTGHVAGPSSYTPFGGYNHRSCDGLIVAAAVRLTCGERLGLKYRFRCCAIICRNSYDTLALTGCRVFEQFLRNKLPHTGNMADVSNTPFDASVSLSGVLD